MIHRIQKIMEEKNISVGQFADMLEVQRSGMSHILSGRNNPSLHFVKRILEVYPDIRSNWLLFGEGEMFTDYVEKISVNNSSATENVKKEQLIDKKIEKVPTLFEQKVKPTIEQKEKVITKVIIFYADNSFEVSYPK